jgi:hypothetical protein
MVGLRRIVTGTCSDGRSSVLQVGDAQVAHRVEGQVVIRELWRTLPPQTPARATSAATPLGIDLSIPPGASRWEIVEWEPSVAVPMHTTPTVDYDFVVSGELTLILEDGEITLRPGDAVVVPGIPHAWRSGADGCVFLVTLIGAAASE